MAKSRTHRVKLTYPTALVDKPILHGLITKFDVVVNVVEANVSPVEGWLVVDMTGSAAAILQSLEWASDQGVHVEHLSRT
jgi:ABC-type methionine transport system ATPase subunit